MTMQNLKNCYLIFKFFGDKTMAHRIIEESRKKWALNCLVYVFHLLNLSLIHNKLFFSILKKGQNTIVYTLSIKYLLMFTFFAVTL